jgi:hypothetical protein
MQNPQYICFLQGLSGSYNKRAGTLRAERYHTTQCPPNKIRLAAQDKRVILGCSFHLGSGQRRWRRHEAHCRCHFFYSYLVQSALTSGSDLLVHCGGNYKVGMRSNILASFEKTRNEEDRLLLLIC